MRKFYYLWLLALFTCWQLNAQAGDYAFTASSGTYTPLSGGTAVPDVVADSDISTALPIGFTFNFDGADYTEVIASSNGWLSFNTTAPNSNSGNNLDNIAANFRPLVAPYWEDMDDATGSAASYLTTGTAPNRVFTFEWLNFERYNYNSTVPVISMQVKLYETTNVVEFVYRDEGNSSTMPTYTSASIGITGINTFLSLSDTSSAPTASNTTETDNINTIPASGQVYTFTPPACASPGGVTISNVSSDSATLSWTAGTGQTDWEYVVQAAGTGEPTAAGTPSSSTSVSLNNLSASTTYEVYLRTDCGGGVYSGWAGPYTFSTLCPAFTATYYQNFDAETAPAINICWTPILQSSSTYAYIQGYATNPASAPNSVRFYNSSDLTGTYLLVSPEFSDFGNDKRIRVKLRQDSYSEDGDACIIGTMSDPSDASTFTPFETIDDTVLEEDTWVDVTVSFDTYTGTDNFVAIKYVPGATYNYFQVDDFYYEDIPSCLDISDLAVGNISNTGVDISWTASASGETAWEYVVQAAGTGIPTASGVSTSNNPTTVGSLSPATEYEVWVRADCGGGDNGQWVGPVTFYTACNAFTATYVQNFDDETAPMLNTCWKGIVENTTNAAAVVNTSTTQSVTPSNSVHFYDAGDSSGTFLLVSPQFSDFGNDKRVRMMLRKDTYTDDGDYYEIGTMSDPNDSSTFTAYETINDTDLVEDEWVSVSVLFDNYTGTDQYVAVNYVPGATYNNLWLDNFIYDEIPSCFEPTDVAVALNSTTEAVVSWMAGDSAETAWEYVVQPNGTGEPTAAGTPTSTDMVTVSNLTEYTWYEVWVRADCGGGDFSGWVGPYVFYTGHCTPELDTTASYINDFTTTGGVTNISNATSDTDNYGSYLTQSASIAPGDDLSATVTITGPTVGCAIWVDWNNNLEFETSEVEYSTSGYGSGPFNATFTIPCVEAGDYVMRVMIDYNDSNPGDDDACSFGYGRGEIEDYTITVLDSPAMDWVNVQYAPATVTDCETFDIYTQGYEAGSTDTSATAVTGITVEIAVSTDDTDPSTWDSALWQSASATPGYDFAQNNDEYTYAAGPLTAGTYYIASRWMIDGGCAYVYGGSGGVWNNDNYEVTVTASDDITATSDEDTICEGGEAVLSVTSDDTTYTYVWDNNAGSGDTVTVMPTATTTYTVTASNPAGCVKTAEVTITVNDAPDAPTADTVQEFCSTSMATVADLVATGTTLTWYDSDDNVLDASTVLVDNATYYVTETSAEGCESETTLVVVNFDDSLCPPANDECANGIGLSLTGPAMSGTTQSATGTDVATCGDGMTDGVWYMVNGDGADITVVVSPDNWDAEVSVFEGSCGAFTSCMGNADDYGTGGTETVTFSSVAGTTYYILVGSNDGSSEGEFAIQSTSNMGIEDIDATDSSITLYPNPVVDVLQINVEQSILVAQIFANDGSLVEESNMLTNNAINVAALQSGTYILRVILEDHSVVTEKFIKK